MEDLAFSTLEGLTESMDDTKHQDHLPPLNEGYEDNFVLSDDIFYGLDGQGEDSSDYDKEEEHKDENMADQDFDWMAQGNLSIPDNLQRMLRHLEKLLPNYDPDKKTTAEYHLDVFYLHL